MRPAPRVNDSDLDVPQSVAPAPTQRRARLTLALVSVALVAVLAAVAVPRARTWRDEQAYVGTERSITIAAVCSDKLDWMQPETGRIWVSNSVPHAFDAGRWARPQARWTVSGTFRFDAGDRAMFTADDNGGSVIFRRLEPPYFQNLGCAIP